MKKTYQIPLQQVFVCSPLSALMQTSKENPQFPIKDDDDVEFDVKGQRETSSSCWDDQW